MWACLCRSIVAFSSTHYTLPSLVAFKFVSFCPRPVALLIGCLTLSAQVHPLAHAESLTQVYGLLSTLLQRGDDALSYAIYDNACALARYARHPLRRERTPAASAIAALTFVIDSFHLANHTACITEGHDFFLPEVRRERHPQLAEVNTQTAEQFFSWADPFVRSTASMTPAVFQAFVLILVHLYNSVVCNDSAARRRPRPARRRNGGPAPVPLRPRRAPSENEAVQDAPAPPAPVVVLRFRRNPRGVGIWGAGKYHWNPNPAARRPPCNIVSFETLPETIEVVAEDIDFLPDVGFILHFAGARHQVCRTCAFAARHAGLLVD